jgi:hypothetical protein
MTTAFQPKFQDFQGDIERYLVSVGKRERVDDGMIVFRGYPDALKLMLDLYLDQEAYAPLVSEFRSWNWEKSYNDSLMDLTDALMEKGDWTRHQRLWDKVIAKRQTPYNEVRKLERDEPGILPQATVKETEDRLLETLERVKTYAGEFGAAEDSMEYSEMMEKVMAGGRV